jgi:hypothetical protein
MKKEQPQDKEHNKELNDYYKPYPSAPPRHVPEAFKVKIKNSQYI